MLIISIYPFEKSRFSLIIYQRIEGNSAWLWVESLIARSYRKGVQSSLLRIGERWPGRGGSNMAVYSSSPTSTRPAHPKTE